ncbi:16S rRNA (uracil(1498)-N(3))-methyltransferase [Senegalia massiliensis]|uniref:16S rRNA (uracil(1498)-N(3))-methyltransferase n=1 Tax=Senegalia massiliensis TaxID=1720316 RepID=UPI001030EAB7|nr:16S rRNA (uracil(1498)-N(3))-methyltransferase [Senegalia massiliensis]
MNRFFVSKDMIDGNSIIIQDKDDIKHIKNVLRLKENDKIEISDGNDSEYIVKIDNITNEYIKTTIVEKNNIKRESDINITLYQGFPKSSKMDIIIQKVTELGVKKIVPIITDRTVVKINNKKKEEKKLERFKKIVVEASKQSKRGIIPEVSEVINLNQVIENMKITNDFLIVPYESENEIGIKDVLSKKKEKDISIIIGPEGGFSKEEINKLQNIGANIVSLGPRILRTETAGIALISMIMYELGDVGVI